MPDISKLPELADLFGTTIDQLLGRKVPILEAAAAGSLADTPIRPEELAEAAPLLTPKQMDEASSGVDIDGIDPVLLPSLLPFLDTEMVDRMLHRAAMQGQEISEFLPFASEDAIDAAGLERASKGQDISSMLPFMCEDTIDSIARNKAAKGESISSMLPFMYEDTIDEIALGRIRQRERIDDLLPFVSSRLTNKLAELAFPEK